MSTLEQLPAEIIRQIASFGTFSTLSALTQTNVKLRNALSDWTVFRDLRRPTYQPNAQQCDCGESLAALSRCPLSKYRVGYDERFMNNYFRQNSTSLIPFLLTSDHPVLLHADIKSLLEEFDCNDPKIKQLHSFCLVVRALSANIPPGVSPTAFNYDYEEYRKTLYGTCLGDLCDSAFYDTAVLGKYCGETLQLVLSNTKETESSGPQVEAESLANIYTIVYHALVVTIVESFLYLKYQAAQAGSPEAKHYISNASQIPFLSFMSAPIPRPPAAFAQKFNTSHLDVMSSPDFIQRGHWTGLLRLFYCPNGDVNNSFGWPADDPWPEAIYTKISFVAAPGQVDPNEVVLRFGPVDGRSFSGVLKRDSGIVRLQHETIQGPWNGLMTPFGIFSVCLVSPCLIWMWLWKDEWTASTQNDSG